MSESSPQIPAKVGVKVKAIDGKFVVLEDISNGHTIHWPIEKIVQPLKIGSELFLELKNGEDSMAISTPVKAGDDDERRKLLEELVN